MTECQEVRDEGDIIDAIYIYKEKENRVREVNCSGREEIRTHGLTEM